MSAELDLSDDAPVPALRGHVQRFWRLRGACDAADTQLVVPDGCMGLVLSFGAPLEQLVDGQPAAARSNTLFIGEIRRPFTTRVDGDLELLGVQFRPGAALAFADAPSAELVDRLADEAVLRRSLAQEIAGTVHGADPEDRLERLQAALVNALTGRRLRGPSPLVRTAVGMLATEESVTRIEELADELRVSRRHLERRFRAEIGVSPKTLAMVLRFRRVLGAIESRSEDWTSMALRCGYFDQAHLIRDFKRFTGGTPGNLPAPGAPFTELQPDAGASAQQP